MLFGPFDAITSEITNLFSVVDLEFCFIAVLFLAYPNFLSCT